MDYKGYPAKVEFDPEEHILVGRIIYPTVFSSPPSKVFGFSMDFIFAIKIWTG